ncbi:MAG TPA: GNAT family N-acetyltransferase, partial [Sphingomonadales bacterium]
MHSRVTAAANVQSVTTFAEVGPLEVRLAETEAELLAAQRLRYRVFYEEMGARPNEDMARERRDFDRFDEICDHLLVVDRSRPLDEGVVGTYRLLRESVAGGRDGFY